MATIGNHTNYYEVLEVQEDAPTHEVHKAYQRAKSTYSSDNPALYSMFSVDEARELLRLIEEAYAVLGNPGLRKTYDEARSKGELPQLNIPVALKANSVESTVSLANASGYGSSVSSPMSRPSSSNSSAHPSQVMAEHRQLPDFPLPPSSIGQSMETPAARASAKAVLPPGTGRTSLSTYKIDESFETELKGVSDFDGAMLQRTRLYKNISIDRLSEATRISRSYLMAVETNDYKSLPAAVFTRGFIVQVARVLGLNEQSVAASYIKMFRAGGGK